MSKKVQRQSRILDQCLESILTGKTPVGDILRQFPSDAQELTRMLTLAVETRDSLAPDYPKPAYVAASRRRILSRANRRLQQSTRPRAKAKPAWRWQPAQVFISLMLAIGILAISTGAVQAANAALPGDALYGLKRGIERARLAVTWSASGDIRLLGQFADMRLAELEALLAVNRLGDMDLALNGYEEALSDLTGLAGEAGPGLDPGSLENILERLDHHQEVLARVSEQVPASVQPAIERALEHSSHSQEVIEQIRQGGSPSDLAPGQQRTPPGQQRTPPGQERTPPGQERKPTPTRTPMPTPVPPTPMPTPEGHTLHVSALTELASGGNAGNWVARVVVTIVRNDGQSVTGVTVYGTWTYAGGGPDSISCNPSLCASAPIKTGATTATFTVTNVSGPYAYAPGDNVVSQIVVQAPPQK